MLELKTKKELSQYAHNLAVGYDLVRHKGMTYVPEHYLTGDRSVTPAPEETVWAPLTREDIRMWSAEQYSILFSSDGELSSFDFMVAQNAKFTRTPVRTLLVRTDEGLRELRTDGKLHEPTGKFIPNTLGPMIHEDPETKSAVFKVLSDWVGGDEEAHSLLHHLATALSPGWSAVKYVLLLGEGRNGKSVLLKMLQAVFGQHNVSSVTRQHIADQSPIVCELNNKLLNIVFDGRAEYVKDSGMEKSLIAGEPVPIRRLYESTPTTVQTNALFIEGLNREPKSTDKSLALQKRLVRFQFPNVYALDHKFERYMLSDNNLGAFLSLLIDHYVTESDVAAELAPTSKAMELALEHMFVNSLALQYVKFVETTDAQGADSLIGMQLTELAQKFASWRLKENDISTWSEPDILAMFQPVISTERRSIRDNGKVRKIRVVESLKEETLAFIETLKGEEADDDALVAE